MRKILATMMALALTIGAQAQEAIDTAQFVAVYDYECRTQDADGLDVTDRMQLVVQVGRTVTKSMPLSAYKGMDMEEEDDIMAAHQEAYLHMPTVWTGYPNGQTTVRDWIFPHEFVDGVLYRGDSFICWPLAAARSARTHRRGKE